MATAVRTADGVYELDKPHSTVEDGDAELSASAAVESVSIVDPPQFREHAVRRDDGACVDERELAVPRAHDAFTAQGGLRDPEPAMALSAIVTNLIHTRCQEAA